MERPLLDRLAEAVVAQQAARDVYDIQRHDEPYLLGLNALGWEAYDEVVSNLSETTKRLNALLTEYENTK